MSTPINDAFVPGLATRNSDRWEAPDTRLRGRRLILARVVWVAAVTLIVVPFLAKLPAYYTFLQTICTGATCGLGQPTLDSAQAMQRLGLSVATYAAFTLALTLALAFLCFAVSAVIFWRRSDDWMALLVALMVVATVTLNGNDVYSMNSAWGVLTNVLAVLGSGVYVLVLALFPDGRFVPRWMRWLLLCWALSGMVVLFFPDAFFGWPFYDLLWRAELVLLLIAQVYRSRTAASPLQRQQTKWILFGGSVAVILIVGLTVPTLLFPSLGQAGSFYQLVIAPVYIVASFIFPLCLGLAILRYRLYDIDIIINRTLVYGLLTGTLVFAYVVLVIGLQYLLRLFSFQSSSLALVGSTLMIAAMFQPLRRRIQRTINHLMYGERDDPYAVLTRLGQRLEATLAPDAVLPTIVETVAQTLKLAYVAITLMTDERRPIPDQASPLEDAFVPVASSGSPTAHPLRLPLVYQTETLGYLLIGPRPGETLTSANYQLLTALARQIGISAHSVQLTTELQQARASLVLAREEERRRLRRDLHDGLGPQLASQALTLSAVRKLLRDDPDAAEALLVDATAHAQEAITDIRRLVYALRPPALDDLGLVAALRDQAAQYGSSGVVIILEAPAQLPPLPAAVEVACYRIVQESLTNVIRHAHAHNCTIRLIVNESLCLEVTDNGDGLPTAYRAGVGLTSMRERAKELGGTCVIDRVTGGGTRVCAQLPLL